MNIKYVPNNKILYVDDEEGMLATFKSLLRKTEYEIFTLDDSAKIENMLEENGPFSVVLSDQRMPEVYGSKLLEIVRSKNPNTIRLLVTGYSDLNDTIDAVNLGGIDHYISKPWVENDLLSIISASVEKYNLVSQNKFLMEEIERKNRQLEQLLSEIRIKTKKLDEVYNETLVKIIKLTVQITSMVIPPVAEHIERVRALGHYFVEKMEWHTKEEKWNALRSFDLFACGLGVIGIKEKPNFNMKLTDFYKIKEYKNHNLIAYGLLKDIPGLEEVAKIIKYQSKNFDGSGLPEDDLISKQGIPLISRILKILIDNDLNSPGLYFSESKLKDYQNYILVNGSDNIQSATKPHLLKINTMINNLANMKSYSKIYDVNVLEQLLKMIKGE